MFDNVINYIVNSYSHDAFFHYLVVNHDEIRRILCQKMLEETVVVSTTVENSIYYGEHEGNKKYILDIVAKDEQGNIYNIEMQCYHIDEGEMKRLQVYGFRLSDAESKKGEDYRDLRPVKQMIINNNDPIKGLNHYIHRFSFFDEEHQTMMPYNLNEIIVVQLAYLDMSKEINVFDELMYLFKYNHAYDKIKADKSIMEAIEMHNEYVGSNEWILAAERERDRMAKLTRENAHKRKMEEFENKLSQLEKSYIEMKQKTDDQEKSFNEMKQKTDDQEKSFNEMKQKTDDQEKAFNEMKQKTNEQEKANNELSEEIVKKLKELERINAELESKKELYK